MNFYGLSSFFGVRRRAILEAAAGPVKV